jgi:hypothetical protein
MVLEAVVSCSHKTMHHALLLGEWRPGVVCVCVLQPAALRHGLLVSLAAPTPAARKRHCCDRTRAATAAGLLNSDEGAAERRWVEGLVRAAADRLAAGLAAGGVDDARLLLRFLASLVATRVLQATDVLRVMQDMVDAAQAQATAGVCT